MNLPLTMGLYGLNPLGYL